MTTRTSPTTNRRDRSPIAPHGAPAVPAAVATAPPREVWALLGSIAATELAMVAAVLWASSVLDAAGAIATVLGAMVLAVVASIGARASVGLVHAPRRGVHRRPAVPAYTLGNGS